MTPGKAIISISLHSDLMSFELPIIEGAKGIAEICDMRRTQKRRVKSPQECHRRLSWRTEFGMHFKFNTHRFDPLCRYV